MLVALAGGVGAARFLRGLVAVYPGRDILVIGNTGDDIELHGLHICPDLDSVMYTLAGRSDEARGWGLANETWVVRDALVALGEPGWFGLGDQDVATHVLRTRLLSSGLPLSDVTADLCARFGLQVRIVPMSDDPVETRVTVRWEAGSGPEEAPGPQEVTGLDRRSGSSWGRVGRREPGGRPDVGTRDLGFQEYWVGRGGRDEVLSVRFDGIDVARPAPGVLEAIAAADALVVCPSNPVVSIAPILAVPGIRDALADADAPVVAVSPIVGGAPVRGMADRLLPAWGAEVSAAGVAGLYVGLADVFVVDTCDADQRDRIVALGMECVVAPSVMTTQEDACALATTVLKALRTSR